MLEAITYVGIDAHKKNLAIAMLVGNEATPTTWTVANDQPDFNRLVQAPRPKRASKFSLTDAWFRKLFASAVPQTPAIADD